MISISGIEEKENLERLPYFNKSEAAVLIGKMGKNLDAKIGRLVKNGYLITLKKGFYVSKAYLILAEKTTYCEYISNMLRYPSYLSLEYILSSFNLIPESVNSWTSITLKSSRVYGNELGSFVYKNVKPALFCGFNREKCGNFWVLMATKAKALFDYLYLKRNLGTDIEGELREGLRINWDNFSLGDVAEFKRYIRISRSKKLKRIINIIDIIKSKR